MIPRRGIANGVLQAPFNVKSLFAKGEQGAWYDPSDFSALYQDSAGTTPVTALGQPVGKILDKSGRGNHASQTTSASRPTVEARVNLLTKTNAAFSEGPWAGTGTTASGSRITATAANSNHIRYQTYTHNPDRPVRYRVQVAKKIGFGFFQLCYSDPNRVKCTVNLETGEFVVSKRDGADAVVTVTDTGTGRWEVTITGSNPAAAGGGHFNMGPTTSLSGAVNAYQEPVFTGTGEYMDVYEPDLRLASDSAYPYQKVNTATDYVDVGAPRYLQFDGVDDGMATASIDFSPTDKMTVWTGIRKLSDAAQGVLVELSANASSNAGSFNVSAPSTAAANYSIRSGGTTSQTNTVTPYTAPISNVITGVLDIGNDILTARVNGVEIATVTSDQGTGNYGNYPLYLFRRGGTTLPFKGNFYGLVIRGTQSTPKQISQVEKYLAAKTGVSI